MTRGDSMKGDGNEPVELLATVTGRRFTPGELALWNLAGLAGLAPPDEAYPGASVLEWAHEVLEAGADTTRDFGGVDFRDMGELAAGTVNAVRDFLGRKGLLTDTRKVQVRTQLEERDRDSERLFQGSLMRRWRTVPEGEKVPWPELLDADGSLRVRTEGDGAGLLEIDALLAELLAELGQPKTAAKVRATTAEERGRRWLERHEAGQRHGPKACTGVVGAVWKRILAERERAKEAAERAKLAHGVISRRALRTLQHTVRVGANAPELEGHSLVLDTGERRGPLNVATVPSELVRGLRKERVDAAMRGAGLIATTGWNMLLHKGAVASSLRQFNGEQHPGLYRFAGYAGMADALGLASAKHRQALPDMLEFGELYRFDLGDGFEPAALWAHRVEKVGGEGQGRRLQWSIHPWVYGADVRELPKGAEKELVFLSPQPAPMVAKVSPNLSAAQWALWWQFHSALALRRAELLDTGAMTLDESWWQAVAEAAGWSAKQKLELLPKAIARYTSDLVDQLLEREPGKPWVFKPGRSLGGVAEGLKKQEARFRGNSAGGKAKAKKREERMVSGWRPARGKGAKKPEK